MSKWTAVSIEQKQKHFLVSKPEVPDMPIVEVEIEAVYSKVKRVIPWRQLHDVAVWKQGWH
jgi:tryptophan-rich hypothetical protein